MRKKISFIIVLFLICLVACGMTDYSSVSADASIEDTAGFDMVQVNKDAQSDIYEYRDAETGVHYFVYNHKSGYGGMGGICPRYNADGTLYVD